MGVNPWTGKADPNQMLEHVEFVEGRLSERQIAEYRGELADYVESGISGEDAEIIRLEIQQKYGMEISERGLSTLLNSEIYGMTPDLKYVNLAEGNVVGGYLDQSRGILHISPYYARSSTNVQFDAIIGHELIRLTHLSSMGSMAYTRKFSEYVAYRHTYNTYLNSGNYGAATRTYNIANELGFWGTAPSNYYGSYPKPYDFPFNY